MGKHNLAKDSPARIPAKMSNVTGAFPRAQTSPVTSRQPSAPKNLPVTNFNASAEIVSRIKEDLQKKGRKDDPTWANTLLLIGLFEQQQLLLQQMMANAPPTSDQAEEKERKRSIVIAGLPETSGKPSKRAADDKKNLVELFDELNVETEMVAAYRMGRPTDADGKAKPRPRLVKVVLANSHQQQRVLRYCGALKKSTAFKGVFVRPSLTKEEREEDDLLRKTLWERRKGGENCKIVGWYSDGSRRIESIDEQAPSVSHSEN